jgi:hypothetical protein
LARPVTRKVFNTTEKEKMMHQSSSLSKENTNANLDSRHMPNPTGVSPQSQSDCCNTPWILWAGHPTLHIYLMFAITSVS